MDTSGHKYVKPIRTTSAPSRLVVAVPVVHEKRGGKEGRTTYVRGIGAWLTIGRRIGTRWIGSEEPEYVARDMIWDWFEDRCRERGRIYVISPNASDFLTQLEFWKCLTSKRFSLSKSTRSSEEQSSKSQSSHKRQSVRLVLAASIDILLAHAQKGSMIFVSSSNFTNSTAAEIRAETQNSKNGSEPCPTNNGLTSSPERMDCETLTTYFRRSMATWVEKDSGTWRDTVSQMGVSLWRRKFLTHKVCKHGDEQASELETACLHGGRASCWYFGDVGWRLSLDADCQTPPPISDYPPIVDTIHRLDVRAMYPALLRSKEFPVRLLGVESDVKPDRLPGICRHWGAIARVRLQTSLAEFPVRLSNRTAYPIGSFDTVLAGPELAYAAEIGAVKRVFALARYEMQPAFAAYADYLLSERMRLIDTGDKVAEDFVKRLSNSFGGKFAQRSTYWETRSHWVPPVEWGRWLRKDETTRTYTNCRVIAGLVQERVTGRAGSSLLAAVFAYLTSYGRTQMRELRQRLSPQWVLSQDTDGIWLIGAGLESVRKQGISLSGNPGELREEGEHRFARFYDAQHYYVGGCWTLAGYSDGFRVRPDGFVEHDTECNPIRSYPRAAPKRTSRTRKHTRLARVSTLQAIGKDGWSKPPVMAFASLDHSPPSS